MKIKTLKFTALCAISATLLALPITALAADVDTNTPATTTNDPAGPMKFYGSITAIDTNVMTITVGDQTFTISAETEMTKDNKKATLADAVTGEPARGTYTKRSDGKLVVTKVRFGKRAGGGKNKKARDATAPDTKPADAKTGDSK